MAMKQDNSKVKQKSLKPWFFATAIIVGAMLWFSTVQVYATGGGVIDNPGSGFLPTPTPTPTPTWTVTPTFTPTPGGPTPTNTPLPAPCWGGATYNHTVPGGAAEVYEGRNVDTSGLCLPVIQPESCPDGLNSECTAPRALPAQFGCAGIRGRLDCDDNQPLFAPLTGRDGGPALVNAAPVPPTPTP